MTERGVVKSSVRRKRPCTKIYEVVLGRVSSRGAVAVVRFRGCRGLRRRGGNSRLPNACEGDLGTVDRINWEELMMLVIITREKYVFDAVLVLFWCCFGAIFGAIHKNRVVIVCPA